MSDEVGASIPTSVCVIGGGAAGLVAAIFAARSGADVTLIERTRDGGRKILISGGGRCNVLPSEATPERFVTDSGPQLMRGLLRSWPLVQQRAFFEQDLDVPLVREPDTGKLFPVSNRARDVRDALIAAGRAAGVRFQFETSVVGLASPGHGWTVHTSRGSQTATRVIVATGGLSVPNTGSDGAGLRILESLGHRLHPVYPALTPLTTDPPRHAGLSGISLTVRLRGRASVSGKVVERSGGFLFTHRGYSGPAVLDISHVATRNREATIRVQWGDSTAGDWEQRLAGSNALVSNVLSGYLPQRLAQQLLVEAHVPLERRASELRRSERTTMIDMLTAYVLPWTGDEGFKKAEVTGGGVALEEVDPTTLESRGHRGLFLCGELLDAFGPIGGHNFSWAWATGRLAGRAAAIS